MTWTNGSGIALLTTALLCGCASAPREEVVTSGTFPRQERASYDLAPGNPESLAEIAGELDQCLRSAGLERNAEKPDYFVEWALSDRPANTALIMEQVNAPVSADPKRGKARRFKSSERFASLSVSIVDTKRLTTTYKINVTERYKQTKKTRNNLYLLELACIAIKNPAITAGETRQNPSPDAI